MMKKIAFCLLTMNLGGVERELITVLKEIHNDYDITLLLLYQENDDIISKVPSDVKIRIINIDKSYYIGNLYSLVKKRVKKGHFIEAATIILKRIFKIGMTGVNVNLSQIPTCNDVFDTVICYHIHAPLLLRYVAEKVQAKRKVAWIHNDFYASGYPVQRLKKYIVMFDEFVAVSKKVEKEFRMLCSWYKGQISTAHNYMNAEEIKNLSQDMIEESIYLNETKIKILTVGRFSEQKGIDYAIEVAALLKKAKIEFHWFLIGYGELENMYRQLIRKHDLDECFTILGKKNNPYPYIINCDIYVQPSRHEAYPLTLMEAKILRRPIVCTNFNGADEQIENGINGVIVPIGNVQALYEEIKKLMLSEELRQEIIENLKDWNVNDELANIVNHF